MNRTEMALWIEQAKADGWTEVQVHEGAMPTLTREGFHVLYQVFYDHGSPFVASISLYGPDRLAVEVPSSYSFEAIKAGLRTCGYCYQLDTETFRVGFAGRCCAKCLPIMRERLEYPGWAD